MEIKKIKLFSSAGNLLARRMRDKGDTAVGYVVGWRSGSGGGGWFGTMISDLDIYFLTCDAYDVRISWSTKCPGGGRGEQSKSKNFHWSGIWTFGSVFLTLYQMSHPVITFLSLRNLVFMFLPEFDRYRNCCLSLRTAYESHCIQSSFLSSPCNLFIMYVHNVPHFTV